MRKILLSILFIIVILLCTTSAGATLLNFEDMPDLTSVGDFYASYGVHFSNALSLTAGFSLNEFDYPPSSGLVAIGDDNTPIMITFDTPAENIFANFTYGSQLTFTAYDDLGTLIGSYVNPASSNLGSTEFIPLSFANVSSLEIAGAVNNYYIMDDLNFTPVPEPSTIALLGSGLMGLWSVRKRFNRT